MRVGLAVVCSVLASSCGVQSPPQGAADSSQRAEALTTCVKPVRASQSYYTGTNCQGDEWQDNTNFPGTWDKQGCVGTGIWKMVGTASTRTSDGVCQNVFNNLGEAQLITGRVTGPVPPVPVPVPFAGGSGFCGSCNTDSDCGTYNATSARGNGMTGATTAPVGPWYQSCTSIGSSRVCTPRALRSPTTGTGVCPAGFSPSGASCVPRRGTCSIWREVYAEGALGHGCSTDADCAPAGTLNAQGQCNQEAGSCTIPCTRGTNDCVDGFACGLWTSPTCYAP